MTDFPINSPSAAETPVTQRCPCYSAVSASLTNPLPECSKYSPFCHTFILRKHFTRLSLLSEAPLAHGSRARALPALVLYVTPIVPVNQQGSDTLFSIGEEDYTNITRVIKINVEKVNYTTKFMH